MIFTLLLACGLSRIDVDGDGFAAPKDCDDRDHTVYPFAVDAPYDGVDADCDGADDFDADGDLVSFDADCDDRDPTIYPGHAWRDEDGDGYGAEPVSGCDGPIAGAEGDCDDADAEVHPGVTETCGNGIDDNCDGVGNGCDLSGDRAAATADLVLTGEGDYLRAGGVLAVAEGTGDSGAPGLLVGAPSFDTGHDFQVYGYWDGATIESGKLRWADLVLGSAHAQTPVLAMAGLGDLDGNGTPDIGVSYAQDQDYAGTVWLLSTSAADEGDAWLTLHGLEATEQLGTALAGPGDITGDGLPDLLLGANGYCGDCALARTPGRVFVLPGPISPGTTLAMARTIVGENDGDAFGNAIAALGDTNGDGAADFAVAAVNYGQAVDFDDVGRVYVFTDPVGSSTTIADATTVITGMEGHENTADNFGQVLAGLGDVDGDGLADLGVGAPGVGNDAHDHVGAVYVFHGPFTSGRADVAEAEIEGEGGESNLGTSLAGGGDVDGDQLGDLLLGAPGSAEGVESQAGHAYLYFGPIAGTHVASDADGQFSGAMALDGLGSAVALGDLNNDGHADAIIGADAAHNPYGDHPGAVYVFFGGGG